MIAVLACDLEDGVQAFFEAISIRLRGERHLHTQDQRTSARRFMVEGRGDVRCGTLVEDWE
ncbi:MAG: hypothetical protein R8G01_22035 [Ilumatobacteraceae bacterium]|nr:hypothetical protein [Ilumatobacteraceae bacterium]